MIGRTLGHYRIVEKTGEGGMGIVYRAHDEHLDCDVAVKVLPPGTLADEAARKRFRKEALALSKLNHPNIATVHDFDTQDGVDFLVMEHIPGMTLSDKLAAGPLPEKDVGRLGLQLAEGLAAAHEQGVIHRDLKPGNLRVTPDRRLKILDFGLAKLIRPPSATVTTESRSETEGRAGTPLYMAPEQQRGEKADARTDIYAAGLVLLQMATGELPVVRGRALAGKLSPDLERIIGKCLEEDPELRYQSAKELAVDLRRLATPTAPGLQAPAWGTAGAFWRSARRPVPLVVGVSLALLVLLLGFNVGGLRDRLFTPSPPQIDSLAVLPLKNLMGDAEQDYFVDGMHEALTAELSKISALKVISRTSAMRYKDTDKPMPQIARELAVEGLIEGSVLREGDQVRITVQLIHGPTDKHLWAESYQRELRGILTLQSDVASAIANEIKVAVTPAEATLLAHARPVNPEAHEFYLRGRYFWNKRGKNALLKGLEYFEQAVKKDPAYALAYAGVADSYAVLGNNELLRPEETYPKARAAARKALEIDPNLAEVHASLALVLGDYDWDWQGAEQEYQLALRLNPGYATAYNFYAVLLSSLGRHEEAIARARKARELDPVAPRTNANMGWRFYLARRYDEALTELQKARELFPDHGAVYEYLRAVYLAKGMHTEAMQMQTQAMQLGGMDPGLVAAMKEAYAAKGIEGYWQQELKMARDRQQEGEFVSPYWLAICHAQLGQKDRAFVLLEQAFAMRSARLKWLRVSPLLDPLRSDPRFQDLLRRMNFPP